MRYGKPILIALAALAAGLCFPAPGTAEGPAERYNQMLARRQFLVSTAPARSYSGLEPGAGWAYLEPYGYTPFWVGPGYRHELFTPRGYERFDLPAFTGRRTLESVAPTPPTPERSLRTVPDGNPHRFPPPPPPDRK